MNNRLRTILAVLAGSSTTAYAATGADAEGGGLLLLFFLGFGAVIIAFQAIPGLIMFFGMLRGLFSSVAKESALTSAKEHEK